MKTTHSLVIKMTKQLKKEFSRFRMLAEIVNLKKKLRIKRRKCSQLKHEAISKTKQIETLEKIVSEIPDCTPTPPQSSEKPDRIVEYVYKTHNHPGVWLYPLMMIMFQYIFQVALEETGMSAQNDLVRLSTVCQCVLMIAMLKMHYNGIGFHYKGFDIHIKR